MNRVWLLLLLTSCASTEEISMKWARTAYKLGCEEEAIGYTDSSESINQVFQKCLHRAKLLDEETLRKHREAFGDR